MRLIYLSLFYTLFIASCKQQKTPNALSRDFVEFYKKFHSDSLYQIRHISFPLPGKPPMTDSIPPNFRWTADQWVMHRPFDDMNQSFEQKFHIIDQNIIEEYIIHKTGYGMMRRFVKLGKEWQLSYYLAMNKAEILLN